MVTTLKTKALKRAQVALNDWVRIHAPDWCSPESVKETKDRMSRTGVLAYVSDVLTEIENALDEPE